MQNEEGLTKKMQVRLLKKTDPKLINILKTKH